MQATVFHDLEGERIAHPSSIYSAFENSTPIRTKDGVFSNMLVSNAMSSLQMPSTCISQPLPSRPPQYEEISNMRPPLYAVEAPAIFRLLSDTNQGLYGSGTRVPGIADLLIDGIPLGSWTSFFGPLVIVIISQFVGFLLVLMIVRSHAGHHGAFAGLGLLLAILSINGGLDGTGSTLLNSNDENSLEPSTVITTALDPVLLISVIIVGLSLFFFSFYSYARIRSKAAISLTQLQSTEYA